MQKVRIYIILFGVCTVLFGLGLVLMTMLTSPDTLINLILYYAVVAAFMFSLFVLIGFYLRRWFGQRELLNLYIIIAMRQAFWLAMILIISLVLASFKLFNIINVGLLILAFVFLEFYIASRKSQ